MFCNIVIPIDLKEDRVNVVITEMNYTPPQIETRGQEGLPAIFEVLAGYVVEDSVELFELLDDVGVSPKIYSEIEKWYKGGSYDR